MLYLTADISSSTYSWGGLVWRYIAILVFIAGLAYLSTILLARYYKSGISGRNIKLIEKINLAADRSLWLVELGDNYYFLYIDKNGLTKLDKIDNTTLKLVENKTDEEAGSNFFELLTKRVKNGDKIDEE